ncbi:hypothetical protein QFZ94_005683 [Paraburkholderia sp. JPY465]
MAFPARRVIDAAKVDARRPHSHPRTHSDHSDNERD